MNINKKFGSETYYGPCQVSYREETKNSLSVTVCNSANLTRRRVDLLVDGDEYRYWIVTPSQAVHLLKLLAIETKINKSIFIGNEKEEKLYKKIMAELDMSAYDIAEAMNCGYNQPRWYSIMNTIKKIKNGQDASKNIAEAKIASKRHKLTNYDLADKSEMTGSDLAYFRQLKRAEVV